MKKKRPSRDLLRKGVLLNNFGYIKETIANWKVDCIRFLESEDEGLDVGQYDLMSYRQRVCENTVIQTKDSNIREEARALLLILRLCNRRMIDILHESKVNNNIPIII